MAAEAWKMVKVSTIENCIQKVISGILESDALADCLVDVPVTKNMAGDSFASQIDFDGESDIDGEDADDHVVENDDDDDMVLDKPQQPVSLNDCLKSLETLRDFFHSHGGDENVLSLFKT